MSSPRIPLHLQKLYQDAVEPIQKSTALDQGTVSPAGSVMEWVADQSCATTHRPAAIQSDYRVAYNRTSGNQVFRRFHNGQLDIEAAKNKVLEAIDKARSEVQGQANGLMTDLDKLILSIHFPNVFNFADPMVAEKMRMSQMGLSPMEVQLVSVKVAQHLQAVMSNITLTSGAAS